MKRDEPVVDELIPRELWEQVTSFAEGECRLWHVGSARFWIRRVADEWLIAFEETKDYLTVPIAAQVREAPEGLQWNRYVAGKSSKIAVHPVLPDRPIVIKPSSPVKILPAKGSQYYIHVPVWVAILEGGTKQGLLAERPGSFLSSTWFGDPVDGELCYSFTSDLYRSPEEREDLPLMAVCPLKIRNGSSSTLDFQRICVRVPHLDLYTGVRYLCTNEVELVYRAPDQSQITYRESVPSFAGDLKHASSPRIPPNRNVIKKSFEYIRSLSLY